MMGMLENFADFSTTLSVYGLAIRSTVALALSWAAAWMLRRHSAAMRHRVWLLGLAASVAVPLVAVLLPSIPLPVVFASEPRESATAEQATQAITAIPVATVAEANSEPTVLARPSGPIDAVQPIDSPNAAVDASMDWTSDRFLFFSWLAGIAFGASVLLVASVRQWIRIQHLPVLDDSEWFQSVQKAVSRLRTDSETVETELGSESQRRPDERRFAIRTRVGNGDQVPCVVGIFRPTLVVPVTWPDWSEEQRDCILLHELAHVQRRDVATQMFARLAVLIQWFNPLAWYAARQLRVERELASDDCVLRTGCSASNYAQQLLRTVKQYRPRRMAMGVAMAHSARLDDRVNAILDPKRNRGGVSRRTFAVAMALTVIGCVTVGATNPSTTSVLVSGPQSDPRAPAWKAGHTYYYSKTLPTSLAFARDGKSLLSADASGQLMSLNLQEESNSYVWAAKVAGSHPVVAYSLDGKSVYATCDDGVIVFDADGKQVGAVEEKGSKPISVGVFPDRPINDSVSFRQVVFGTARGYFVKTWATVRKPEDAGTLSTSTVPKGTEPADMWAVPLAVDPRGRSAIMTGPIDGTGQVAGRAGANVLWAYVCGNYEDGSPGNRIMKGHDTRVVSAAWSKEGSTAVTGDANGRIIEWNPTRLTDEAKIGDMRELRRHEFGGRIAALAISDNGQRIAAYVLGDQGRLYVWNAGEPTDKLRPIHVEPNLGGKNVFASVALSADGKQLAACAGDRDWLKEPEGLTGKVRVWTRADSPSRQPAPKLAFDRPYGGKFDLVVPNNNWVYTTSPKKEQSLRFVDFSDGSTLQLMSFGKEVSLQPLMRSHGRDWMVIGQSKSDSPDKLFNAEVRHANLHPPRKTIANCERLLGLATGGKQLAAVRAGKIELWNTVAGTLIKSAPFEHTAIHASAFSPDAKVLAIADGKSLCLWHWQDDEHERIDTGRELSAIAFSPDGRILAEGPRQGGDVQLRDLATKEIVRTLTAKQPLSVPTLAFTQGGRVLIACDKSISKDQSSNRISRARIFLWDTADGALAHKIVVPGLPQSFDVSPNELYLVARVTGSGGSKLMGWRLDGKDSVRNRGNDDPAADAK